MPSPTPDRHSHTALGQVLPEPTFPFARVLYETPPVQSNPSKRKRALEQPVCSGCSASCNYTPDQIRGLARTSESIPQCSSCFAKAQNTENVLRVCNNFLFFVEMEWP